MYPKKLGILTPSSSAIERTIKLGALPIYVFAPIKTAPAVTAIRSCDVMLPTEVAITEDPTAAPAGKDAAAVMNTRYVGALSRKLDNIPVAQKYCHGSVSPSSGPLD